MSYDLVFKSVDAGKSVDSGGSSDAGGAAPKAVGENIFFSNIKPEYKVYAFYYPGAERDPSLEQKLRQLGEKSGKNLLVNIGELNDPQFDQVVRKFGIKKYPVIAMTALATLASPANDYSTTYARLDGTALFREPEKVLEAVQEIFNLFIQGKVAEAIKKAQWTQRKELVASIGGYFFGALKSLGEFISSRDISFSLTEGKLELKKSGD